MEATEQNPAVYELMLVINNPMAGHSPLQQSCYVTANGPCVIAAACRRWLGGSTALELVEGQTAG